MRVLSMLWIVVGHSFLYVVDVMGGWSNGHDIFKNPLNADPVERHPPGLLLITNAQLVVDTFLLISGLLQSVQTLEHLECGSAKAGARLFGLGLALRYLRLTPSLALVYLCYHFVVPYMGHGPFAPLLQEHIVPRCDDTWWTSFLYIQAFVPGNKERMCMKWTWYLSCDMIYFAVGMAVLPLYLWSRRLVWVILGVLLAGSLTTGTLLANVYPFVMHPSFVHSPAWGALYVNPAVRIVPYIVGLAAGILYRRLSREEPEPESRPRWGALLVALAAMLLVMVLPQTNLGDHNGSWRTWEATAYTIYSRLVWAVAIAGIALLCARGRLEPVANLLAHPLWAPFARLTYGAYLAHPLAIKLGAGRALQFFSFGSWDFMQKALANSVLAYFAAFALWALAERPCLTLAGLALKRPGAKGR